jgi:hypothetical protein
MAPRSLPNSRTAILTALVACVVAVLLAVNVSSGGGSERYIVSLAPDTSPGGNTTSTNSTSGAGNSPPANASAASSCTLNCFTQHYNGSAPPPFTTAHPSSGMRPASYSGHYWDGTVYSPTATVFGASTAYVSMFTPSSGPRWNDAYFELLSAWDNGGPPNYIQLGLSSFYCSWTLLAGCQGNDNWAITTGFATTNSGSCSLNYNTNDYVTALAVNSYYTFEISLNTPSSGYGTFSVFDGVGIGGTLYWSSTFSDPNGLLEVENQELWNSNSCVSGGFSDYQEVYMISNTMSFPQWNFGFDGTEAGSTAILTSDWSGFFCSVASGCSNVPASPHGYYWDYPLTYWVRIDNEAFSLYYPTDAFSINPGYTYYVSNGLFKAAGSGSSNYCSATTCPDTLLCTTGITGSSTTYGTAGYVPNSGDFYDPFVPLGTTPGSYYGSCALTVTSTSPNEVSNWIFYITVL